MSNNQRRKDKTCLCRYSRVKRKETNIIPAIKASDFLNSLLANKVVPIRRTIFDRSWRIVAELIKDEENIQELIIKNGFVKIYRKYSHQYLWSS